jgi:mannose-1-phosphate guanylyltransferase
MIVTPADHVIEPVQEFRRAVHVAEQIVLEHPTALVTFGIPPTFPSTGYGYIHRGALRTTRQGVPVYESLQFKEKPSFDTAERFVASGEFYWNSGIFIWKTAAILKALQDNQPEMYEALQRIAASWDTPQRDAVLRQEYPGLNKISIDFAVMQTAREVLVIQAPYRWDDVGSWLAVERMQPQNADHNTILGEHCGHDTQRCVIVSDAGHLIATVGVRDLIIIQDGNATLVAHRDQEGNVKKIVETLRDQKLDTYL